MTKEQIEAALIKKALELRALIREYEPANRYFELCLIDQYYLTIYNNYWESRTPISISVKLEERGTDDADN